MERNEYFISVNSQKAVDLARSIIGNRCYSSLVINGKKVAQVEIVIDEPGEYNGKPNKWVDFSYINPENVTIVKDWLKNNGFSGCFAVIAEEETNKNETTFII